MKYFSYEEFAWQEASDSARVGREDARFVGQRRSSQGRSRPDRETMDDDRTDEAPARR